MARHLRQTHGATVVVVDWKAHRVERTVAELVDSGRSALGLTADVNDHDSITAMVAATVDRFGRVDGLVNNAHTFTAKAALVDLDVADVDANLATLKGTLSAMQAVHPHMQSRGVGPDREPRVGGGHHGNGRGYRTRTTRRKKPSARTQTEQAP